MTSQKTFFFFHFSVLDTMYRWSMMKNNHSPNLMGIGLCRARDMAAWVPNYPHWNQCKLAWFQTSYKPGQFTLISIGLIKYLCGHISGNHEQIHVKFGVWGFSSCFTEYGHKNAEMQKKKIKWRHTSVLFLVSYRRCVRNRTRNVLLVMGQCLYREFPCKGLAAILEV